MHAIKITVTGAEASVTEKTVLTCGTVGLPVEFIFDEDWDGLFKTAVFRAGSRSYPVVCLQDTAVVPWEVMEKPNVELYIGVIGADADGTVKIPTVWAYVDRIGDATALPDTVPAAPTQQVYDQLLAAVGQAVQIDLDQFVKKTDYATKDAAGAIKIGDGLIMPTVGGNAGRLQIHMASDGGIDNRASASNPIVPKNLDYAVRAALTNPKNVTWSDADKAAVRERIGAAAAAACVQKRQYSGAAIAQGSAGGRVGDAYFVHYTGAQSAVPISLQSEAYTLVCRDKSANFYVGDPTAALHATNKAYVDKQIATLTARIVELENKVSEQ